MPQYKTIQAMAHNWSHSFMSGMNYLDDRYVYQDLNERAIALRGEKVVISWIPERIEELIPLTARVREAVGWYRKGLVEHVRRHNVAPESLRELRTEVYVGRNRRIYVKAVALDDRDREHVAYVRQ